MAPTCLCQQEDAGRAREFILANREHRTLVDESHFDVSLIRCTSCRQLYLRAWYELIDWINGEDSQADWWFPIDEETSARLLVPGIELNERTIDAFELDGRYLLHAWPSGKEPYTQWMRGSPIHFPHD
jgi:hypothetical protein